MVEDNSYKQNKNFIGFFVFPIIPMLVYLIDVVAGSILSDSIVKIYEFFGLFSVEGSISFYNFEYPRRFFFSYFNGSIGCCALVLLCGCC